MRVLRYALFVSPSPCAFSLAAPPEMPADQPAYPPDLNYRRAGGEAMLTSSELNRLSVRGDVLERAFCTKYQSRKRKNKGDDRHRRLDRSRVEVVRCHGLLELMRRLRNFDARLVIDSVRWDSASLRRRRNGEIGGRDRSRRGAV